MRRLDSAGYRTGHLYRVGQVLRPQGRRDLGGKGGSSIPEVEEEQRDVTDAASRHARRAMSLGRAEIEVPPAASSFSANFYSDEATRQANFDHFDCSPYFTSNLLLKGSHI